MNGGRLIGGLASPVEDRRLKRLEVKCDWGWYYDYKELE